MPASSRLAALANLGQLAKELKQQDCLQYAAFCNLAMARCEQTLFNAPGEALALTDAARLFLASECENRALQAPGFDEHLQAALNCYSFAIKVYIEMNQPVMAASLSLELGNALKEMNRPGEAIVHFQRAAELQTQTPIESLLSLWEMATCKILTRDYDGALAVLSEMQVVCQERGLQLPGTNTPVGAFMDIVAKCEISRVLLLMLLEPPPQKLLPEHAQTLERYAWESFDSHSQEEVINIVVSFDRLCPDLKLEVFAFSVNFLPEDVFLLLQSVVVGHLLMLSYLGWLVRRRIQNLSRLSRQNYGLYSLQSRIISSTSLYRKESPPLVREFSSVQPCTPPYSLTLKHPFSSAWRIKQGVLQK
ncbi:hypothetical protein NFI96_034497, partial [Prochilodus magdalenae]